MKRIVNKLLSITLLGFITSSFVQAAPWIEPSDVHIRADLQLLASTEIVTVPVTTYPLMWKGVIDSINKNKSHAQTAMEKSAIERVLRAYKKSQPDQFKLHAGLASDNARFNHFGSQIKDKKELSTGYQHTSEHWSLGIEATYANDSKGEDIHWDNSYIAALLGNWVISAGYPQQWYGPGWDTALTRSTNARPLPSFFITRNSPETFNFPILKWLGPWTFTTGVSKMDDERYIKDTLLWTARATIRPHPNFEFGASRSAQLCGNGKSCNASTWKRMFTGDTNVWSGENPANQLASVDARWTDTLYGTPYSVYWESMGEDAVRFDRFPPFQAKSFLYGADVSYQISQQSITTFFEYSETFPTCRIDGDCAYEHSTYKTGYRYNNKVLGSTYDNDANTYTLGFIGIDNKTNHAWQAHIRYLKLNIDGHNHNLAQGGGNKVSLHGENTWDMDLSYRIPLHYGKLTVGAQYDLISHNDTHKHDTQLASWMSWDYVF